MWTARFEVKNKFSNDERSNFHMESNVISAFAVCIQMPQFIYFQDFSWVKTIGCSLRSHSGSRCSFLIQSFLCELLIRWFGCWDVVSADGGENKQTEFIMMSSTLDHCCVSCSAQNSVDLCWEDNRLNFNDLFFDTKGEASVAIDLINSLPGSTKSHRHQPSSENVESNFRHFHNLCAS